MAGHRLPVCVGCKSPATATTTSPETSSPAWGMLAAMPYDFTSKWTLSSVPMFLLMGFVCYHAGLTRGLFEAARSWLARLPTAVSGMPTVS